MVRAFGSAADLKQAIHELPRGLERKPTAPLMDSAVNSIVEELRAAGNRARLDYWIVTAKPADVAPQAFLTDSIHCPAAIRPARVALIWFAERSQK